MRMYVRNRKTESRSNKFYSRFPEKKYFILPRASIRVFVNFLSNSRSSSFSSLIFVRECQLPCISLQRTIFISSVWRATEVILPSSPTLIDFYCMVEIYERFTELLEPSDRGIGSMHVAESRVLSYFVGLNGIFVRCKFLVKRGGKVTYSMLIKNNVIVSSTHSSTDKYCIIVYMYVCISRYMI